MNNIDVFTKNDLEYCHSIHKSLFANEYKMVERDIVMFTRFLLEKGIIVDVAMLKEYYASTSVSLQ